MKTKPFLSVIIVSFNTKDIILACLNSLYRFTSGINFEVIVVDNASTDGSVIALTQFESTHPNFRLVRSSANIGFGRANNLGVKEAIGKYLLFLNSDTVFTSNNLPYCLKVVDDDTRIGVYSCNLTNRDGSHQPSGGYFPNLSRLIAWQIFLDDIPPFSNFINSIHPHTSKLQPDWLTGAFMLIPARIFKRVGGFDEKIFMYTEELELCYRIKKLRKKIIYDSHTSITHLGGASGGSHLAITKEVEGMLYFWRKHKPLWQIPMVKLFFFVGSLLRYLLFGIISGNAIARSAYKASLSYLT